MEKNINLKKLYFFAGLLISLGGLLVTNEQISIAGSGKLFGYLPTHVYLGIIIMLVGALSVGVSARNDRSNSVICDLPVPRLKKDKLGLAAIVVTIFSWGLFFWITLRQPYEHWHLIPFVVSIVILCFATHRFSEKTSNKFKLKRSDFAIIGFLFLLTVFINIPGLIRYNFFFAGDEGIYFWTSRDISKGITPNWNPLDPTCRWGGCPILDNGYQALVMKFFGMNMFGFRLSEVFVTAFTTILVYLIGITLFGRIAGFSAGVMLASSHYLMGFHRFGYNNTHGIFYGSLVMLMLALAWRTEKPIYTFLTGVSLGLCLYSFPLSMLTWPIVMFFFLGILLRPSHKLLFAFLIVLLGFFMIVWPGLHYLPSNYFEDLTRQKAEVTFEGGQNLAWIYQTTFQAFIAFWSNSWWNAYYVNGSLVDMITGIFLMLGIGIAICGFKNRATRLLLFWFVLGVSMIAVTHNVPAMTRLMYVLPAAVLIAGMAVEKIFYLLQSNMGLNKNFTLAVLICLILIILALNLDRFFTTNTQIVSYATWAPRLKILQEREGKVVDVRNETDLDFVRFLNDFHPWQLNRYSFKNLSQVKQEEETPIYIFVDGNYLIPDAERNSTIQNLSLNLPNYVLVEECDRINNTIAWVFLPKDKYPRATSSRCPLPRYSLRTEIRNTIEPLVYHLKTNW